MAVPPLRPFWWRGNGLGRGSASAIWWGYAPLFLCGLGGGHTPNRERTERAPAKHLQPGGMWGMGWPHQQRVDRRTHCLPVSARQKDGRRSRGQCKRPCKRQPSRSWPSWLGGRRCSRGCRRVFCHKWQNRVHPHKWGFCIKSADDHCIVVGDVAALRAGLDPLGLSLLAGLQFRPGRQSACVIY